METTPQPSIPMDAVFDLLSAERRRHVLEQLRSVGNAISMDALASGIAKREASGPPSGDALRGIRTSLRHVHLPKLADYEVVNHDTAAGVVDAGPNAPLLWNVLDGARSALGTP